MDTREENDGKIPFEKALDQTGFGLYNFLMTGLVGMATISFVLLAYGTTIVVPASACELETTGAQQGLVVAVPMAGGIIGSVVWGYLGDTRGRRRMLLLSFCCAATTNALAGISVNWIMLMVLQFFTITLGSGMYLLSMTLLSESVPLAKRNIIMLLVSSIFLLGQGLMSVIAIPIIPLSYSYYLSGLGIYWNSWRTLQVVYSVPSIICAIWLFFMQESPKFTLAKGEEEEALQILRRIHRLNMGKQAGELPVKGLLREISPFNEKKASAKDQVVPLFKKPYLKNTLIMICLLILFQITVSFIVWMPTILNQFMQLLQSGEGSDYTLCQIINSSIDAPADPDAVPCALNAVALLLLLGMCGFHSVFNGILSMLIDKTGRRNTAMALTAVCGAAGAVVNLVPSAVGGAILVLVFTLGVIVLGFYTAITVALFPTHLRSMAVAATMMGGRVASVGLIQLVNFMLVDACDLAFYIFGALFASSALVLALLPDDRTLRRPLPAPDSEKPQKLESQTSL